MGMVRRAAVLGFAILGLTGATSLAWVVSYGPGDPTKDLKVGLLCGDGYCGRVTVFP